MGIGVMMMVMAMIMVVMVVVTIAVIMAVAMRFQRTGGVVAVQGSPGQSMFLAERLFPTGRVTIALAGTVFQTATNAFHVVMMTFLSQPDLVFKNPAPARDIYTSGSSSRSDRLQSH